jgi:RND family efflux transporter MFP subunit
VLIVHRLENFSLGTGVGGTVTEFFVKVDDRVKKGDPLFRVRDKTLRAQLAMEQAAIKTAQAKLADANAMTGEAKSQLETYESVPDKRAIVQEELTRRRFAVDSTAAKALQAQAELDVAQAQVVMTEAELDRHTIKAPVDGTILQVKIRPGEYAMAGVPQTPLMVLGDVDTLHVRVDIDENDAWRLDPGSPATAYVRGNRNLNTQVQFVRVEPYVVPKRSLTGESTERVDTRVLQALYSFPRGALPVYVGQQMDVFIQAPPVDGTHARSTTTTTTTSATKPN